MNRHHDDDRRSPAAPDRSIDHLADHLTAAYAAPGCPDPIEFLEAEEGRRSGAEAARLAEHAATCPRCAVERDLALAFARPALDITGASPDAPARETARPGRVVPFGRRRPARDAAASAGAPRWRWAAAAALVLAAGLLVRREIGELPPLPGAGGPGAAAAPVMRQGALRAETPAGDLAVPPARLVWSESGVSSALGYRVLWLDFAGREIGRIDVPATSSAIDFPPEWSARLARGVRYAWRVEALGPGGDVLLPSPVVAFRLVPSPSGGSVP